MCASRIRSKVKADPFSLRRHCRDYTVLEVSIIKVELVHLLDLGGVFLWLGLGITQCGLIGRSIREVDADKGPIVLGVKVAGRFVDVLDWTSFPHRQLSGVGVAHCLTLQVRKRVQFIRVVDLDECPRATVGLLDRHTLWSCGLTKW